MPKIALLQMTSGVDPEANAATLEHAVTKAAAEGAEPWQDALRERGLRGREPLRRRRKRAGRAGAARLPTEQSEGSVDPHARGTLDQLLAERARHEGDQK